MCTGKCLFQLTPQESIAFWSKCVTSNGIQQLDVLRWREDERNYHLLYITAIIWKTAVGRRDPKQKSIQESLSNQNGKGVGRGSPENVKSVNSASYSEVIPQAVLGLVKQSNTMWLDILISQSTRDYFWHKSLCLLLSRLGPFYIFLFSYFHLLLMSQWISLQPFFHGLTDILLTT